MELCREVSRSVQIPVAVKISPFFTSLSHFATHLDGTGIDGLVLVNRFHQPDVDIESLEARPTLKLSESSELLPPLRWLAMLSRQLSCDLAVTGGVHTAEDAIKAIMTGAGAVQMVSGAARPAPEHLPVAREAMTQSMEENGYDPLRQMRGSMALNRCPDPHAFERANYMRTLATWSQGHDVR